MHDMFKFIIDLLYDSTLSLGLFYITSKVMDTLRYFIRTQHEQRMAELNNEFYREDRLLK